MISKKNLELLKRIKKLDGTASVNFSTENNNNSTFLEKEVRWLEKVGFCEYINKIFDEHKLSLGFLPNGQVKQYPVMVQANIKSTEEGDAEIEASKKEFWETIFFKYLPLAISIIALIRSFWN